MCSGPAGSLLLCTVRLFLSSHSRFFLSLLLFCCCDARLDDDGETFARLKTIIIGQRAGGGGSGVAGRL